MKLPRVVIFLGIPVVLVIIIVVSSALLLPRLIDSQLVREKISSELVKKTAGSVTFGTISFLWFPRPTVLIENAKISFDDVTQGSIQNTKIYPSIFYLLTGRLVVSRTLLQEPKFRIHLPERPEKPLDLEELERQIRFALVRFTSEALAPRIDVPDGAAEIRIGDKPPVMLESVVAQTVSSPAELRFDLRALSNLSERIKIEGKISPESLASQLDIGIQRLKVNESLTLLPMRVVEYVGQGEASLDVKIASVGLRKIKASVGGSVGPLAFAGHGGTVTLAAKRVKVGFTYEGGAFQVDVEQLDLGAPRLQASGELKIQSGSLSARVQNRNADIAEVSDIALRTAGDTEGVKRILRYSPAGTISEMSFQSTGGSVAEMASSKNMVVFVVMRNGKIFERPEVTYLSPVDVGVELLNIPLRILKVPLNAVRLFTPSGDQRDKSTK
jgi:hypothetical protein